MHADRVILKSEMASPLIYLGSSRKFSGIEIPQHPILL